MFFNAKKKKKKFAFRGPIKYFELAPPELGQLGDSKQFFKSSLIKFPVQKDSNSVGAIHPLYWNM